MYHQNSVSHSLTITFHSIIADFAVTKCPQWPDEIWIFLLTFHPRISIVVSRKLCSCNIPPQHLTQSSSHSIYACGLAIDFLQHRLVINARFCLCKQLLLISRTVRVKYQNFIQSLVGSLTATSAIGH